jgi:poly-gamma-glutamate synthesis protein (capsule biosynthesis protein)
MLSRAVSEMPVLPVPEPLPNILCANIEMPIPLRGDPSRPGATDDFASSPLLASALATSGFSLASIASNHIMDFGSDGLTDTIRVLQAQGLPSVGAGADIDAATRPAVRTLGPTTIGFLSYCKPGESNARAGLAGAAPLKDTLIYRQISELRGSVDLICVQLHWGMEYCTLPDKWQIELARRIIDCGASLVVGHHPHVLQGIERYQNGLIAYSLGNYMFDNRIGLVPTNAAWKDRHESIVLTVSFFGTTIEGWSALPISLKSDGIPYHASTQDGRLILEQLRQRSNQIGKDTLEFYRQAVGNVLKREIYTYIRLTRQHGVRFLVGRLRSIRIRHIRLLFGYAIVRFLELCGRCKPQERKDLAS